MNAKRIRVPNATDSVIGVRGIPCSRNAHLFARAYCLFGDDYLKLRQAIREDMRRGYSWWCGDHKERLVYETHRSGELRQKLAGLCAMSGATCYKDMARRIWIDVLSRGRYGWATAGEKLALFEGRHAGYDPAGFPLFKPSQLLAIVENVHGIAESDFARRYYLNRITASE